MQQACSNLTWSGQGAAVPLTTRPAPSRPSARLPACSPAPARALARACPAQPASLQLRCTQVLACP